MDKEFKAGDRVQYLGKNNEVVDGIVMNVIPAKKKRPTDYWKYSTEDQLNFITYVDVKWDDGTLEQVDTYSISAQDTEIERQFRNLNTQVQIAINDKIKIAQDAIRDAVKISEENGVPFDSHISPISNTYSPKSLEKKFPELDQEFIESVTGAYNDRGYAGWTHSAVC